MKTTTDVAAFVKRNDNFELKIMHDGKVFIVKHGDMSTRSTYLDDALENIAEATRRRSNGMEQVREKASNAAPTGGGVVWTTVTLSPTVTTAPAVIPRSVVNSISYSPNAPAPQINGTISSCSKCGQIPAYALNGGNVICYCGAQWTANTKDTYRFVAHSGSWKFDGNVWSQVAP